MLLTIHLSVCVHATADFEMLLKSYYNLHHISVASEALDVTVVVLGVFTFNNCFECA